MPRSMFVDPKNYSAFRRIFGSEKHKLALIAFLDDILQLDGEHRITEVTFLDPTQRPKVEGLDLSIVAVKCKNARGVTYSVKMQVLLVEPFDRPIIDKIIKAYTNQLDAGAGYPKLNDIVGITICDFEMWPRREGSKVPMVSRWKLQEQQTGTVGLLALQFVFLELPKYDLQGTPETTIDKWAYFFREANNLTMVPDVLNYPPIVEALDAARTATFTVDEWDNYIRAGMAIQNERGMLSLAEKEGEKRGLQKGLDEGRKQGLIQAIRDMCELLSIDCPPDRIEQLEQLDAHALDGLRERIKQTKQWE